jgi:hypothetical protein
METVIREEDIRTRSSPAARYAINACRRLPKLARDCAIVCFSGATRKGSSWFDSAHRLSDAYGLVGTNFSYSGHRRIPPLTLLLLLQNQVAACLSIELGLIGPCLNLVPGATELADAWPSLLSYGKERPVLLVCAAAGDREEEQSLNRWRQQDYNGVEGCFAFLLSTQDHRLGRLVFRNPEPDSSPPGPREGWDLALEPGFRLTRAVAEAQQTVTVSRSKHSILLWEPSPA